MSIRVNLINGTYDTNTAFGIDSLEEKVDIHNDIVTGKATYVPGHACMIRAGHEDLPADIVRYARACAKGHEQWLLLQKEDEEQKSYSFSI